MKTPYEILNVATGANDVEIKQAYLRQVKDNPPDHDQQQFQLIHNAYIAIKDYKSRVSYELFSLPLADFDQLIEQALNVEISPKATSEQFNKLLTASIDETTILNAITSPKKQ